MKTYGVAGKCTEVGHQPGVLLESGGGHSTDYLPQAPHIAMSLHTNHFIKVRAIKLCVCNNALLKFTGYWNKTFLTCFIFIT